MLSDLLADDENGLKLFLVFLYDKSEQENLTDSQLAGLLQDIDDLLEEEGR